MPWDAATDDIGQRLVVVGNVIEFNPRLLAHLLGGKVAKGADAGRGVRGDSSCLRRRDDIGDCFHVGRSGTTHTMGGPPR